MLFHLISPPLKKERSTRTLQFTCLTLNAFQVFRSRVCEKRMINRRVDSNSQSTWHGIGRGWFERLMYGSQHQINGLLHWMRLSERIVVLN